MGEKRTDAKKAKKGPTPHPDEGERKMIAMGMEEIVATEEATKRGGKEMAARRGA